jgi:hypothetical protein
MMKFQLRAFRRRPAPSRDSDLVAVQDVSVAGDLDLGALAIAFGKKHGADAIDAVPLS